MNIQSVWRPLSSRSSAQAKPRYALQRGVNRVRTPITEVEVIDRFTQLFDIDKAGSLERLATQNAKPAFALTKPVAVSSAAKSVGGGALAN
jgi:hypothetical protein